MSTLLFNIHSSLIMSYVTRHIAWTQREEQCHWCWRYLQARRQPGRERESREKTDQREREREKADLLYFSLFFFSISLLTSGPRCIWKHTTSQPNRNAKSYVWICLCLLSALSLPRLSGLNHYYVFYYRLSHVNSEQDVNEQQTAWRTENKLIKPSTATGANSRYGQQVVETKAYSCFLCLT